MPSILDKLKSRTKSKRKSQSGSPGGDGGYSSGAGSESDSAPGGRSSASFEQARPLTRDYGRGVGSGMFGAGSGAGAGGMSGRAAGAGEGVEHGKGSGYEALPNGSSVVVNYPHPPPVPPKEPLEADRQGGAGRLESDGIGQSRELSRKPSPIDKDDIPPRSTSLNPAAAVPVGGAAAAGGPAPDREGGVAEGMSKLAIQEPYAGESRQFHRRSLDQPLHKSPLTAHPSTIPQSSGEPAHESRNRDAVEEHHRHPDRASPNDDLVIGRDFEEPETVIAARKEMAERIAAEARANYKPADGEMRGIFEQAGLGESLDNRGEVEVRTEWLKPVVHVSVTTSRSGVGGP